LQDATSARLPLYKENKQERDHMFILQERVERVGIESRWGRDFLHPSDRAHPIFCTVGTKSLPWG